jgi:hypothetical protein
MIAGRSGPDRIREANMSDIDGIERPHGYAPLAALMSALQGRAVRSEVGCSLEVVSRVSPAPPSDTITCRPRPIDGDRLWFFDGEGEPLAPADHITEAAVVIAANAGRAAESS